MRSRSGFLLIVVAGLLVLMAGMALALLASARRDITETALIANHAQARLLFAAALSYIQESSRIGWDTYNFGSGAFDRHEAMGWIDVRDGTVGPKDLNGFRMYDPTPKIIVTRATGLSEHRPNWPAIGGVARCPMYVMKRPPFALCTAVAPNPIDNQPNPANDPTQPITNQLFGLPLLCLPDPVPLLQITDSSQYLDPTTRSTPIPWNAAWVTGDPTPDNSARSGWFRILRDGPATFIITVGTGQTQGWRDMEELQQTSSAAELSALGGDPAFFSTLRANELRLWWRVEWSSAVGGLDIGVEDQGIRGWPLMLSSGNNARVINQGGTFSWIQALRTEPDRY